MLVQTITGSSGSPQLLELAKDYDLSVDGSLCLRYQRLEFDH